MKKKIYIIFIFLVFFSFSSFVKADVGDLIYNVDSVTATNEKITLKGYAFIHKTQNYVTVYKRTNEYPYVTDNVLLSDGGQKVRIVVSKCDYTRSSCKSNPNNYIVVDYNCKDDADNGELKDYNFYYQQFYNKGEYSVDAYNDYERITNCDDAKLPDREEQCYYEDISFKIDIKISDLAAKFSYGDELKVYIAASNNFFKNRSTTGNEYTNYKELKIPDVILSDTDYIDFVDRTELGVDLSNLGIANFIAIQGAFRNRNQSTYKTGFYGCTRPGTSDRTISSFCGNEYEYEKNSIYHIIKKSDTIKISASNAGLGGQSFLNNTNGPGMYAMCVDKNNRIDACSEIDEHGFCKSCKDGGKELYAYGSWLSFSDVNLLKFKIKDIKRCKYDSPSESTLQCNNSKELESICKELTIITDKGTATVRIEQRGALSSVLNPNRTFSGGGFNFGVMYQNNIKWSYVSTAPKHGVHLNELKDAVKSKMEAKIKGYNDYISSINLSNIYLGGNLYTDNLEKQCFSSKEDTSSKDYSGDGITVSCIFTFPEATLKYDGSVSYTSTGININNKYYTPLYYDGDYEITADIVGLSRIYDIYAEEDSDSEGIKWTGDWETGLTNCKITLYPLLYDKPSPDGKYKYIFIYRPIDLNKPFPNRNAGINWYEWISIESNKQRLKDTYNKSGYTPYIADLNNSNINEIKNYNKFNNYLDWSKINESGMSSFITEKDYMTRERVS